jgi:hypothetical protein
MIPTRLKLTMISIVQGQTGAATENIAVFSEAVSKDYVFAVGSWTSVGLQQLCNRLDA